MTTATITLDDIAIHIENAQDAYESICDEIERRESEADDYRASSLKEPARVLHGAVMNLAQAIEDADGDREWIQGLADSANAVHSEAIDFAELTGERLPGIIATAAEHGVAEIGSAWMNLLGMADQGKTLPR